MPEKVSIATKPLVYSTFRYIANRVWNALGEYVDNSLQSYMDHKETLQHLNPDGKLRVDINMNVDSGDQITITDNAYGIDEVNFQRAFELANIPLDANGLNEFGMGMKVSSIWLSNLWSVETSAYGEPVKRTVIFDLNEVTTKQETSLDVVEEPCNPEFHYTIITLKNLSQNKPSNRQIGVIKKHLASIYTRFIREGELDLYFNDEKLIDPPLKTLCAPFYKDPNGEKITWRKDIHFSAGKYRVDGFIAILDKMSTSTDNGFLLFRRNRVIGTSYDTKYRPKALCGEEGSPRYKRIYGELDLDGFSVSFTKNQFTQDDDFECFISDLADDIKKGDLKIFDQAQKYTPTKNKIEKDEIGKKLIEHIVEGFDKPIKTVSLLESPNIEETSGQDILVPESDKEEPYLFNSKLSLVSKGIEPTEHKVEIDNHTFYLSLGGIYKGNPNGLYDVIKDEENPDHYHSTLNLSNPFFVRFSNWVNNDEDYLPIATIIRSMIATEILMSLDGDETGGDFRSKFNSFFGQKDV